MSGRDLYERFAELRLRRPDWWRLSEEDRRAWEDLAAWLGKR